MSQAAFGGARALTSSAGEGTYGSVKEGDTALRTASFRCLLQIDVWPCTQNWTTVQLTFWFSFHLWAEEAQACCAVGFRFPRASEGGEGRARDPGIFRNRGA